MLCFKSLAISNFSHDLSFDLSTHDSFHQLLKEVKPLALHFDLNWRVFGVLTLKWDAKNPWQSIVFGKYFVGTLAHIALRINAGI